MSTWRRNALQLFPDLRPSLESADITVMQFFFELSGEARRAHRAGDDARLHAIYSFAEWCAREPAKELWNAAGVGFYEHVFDEPNIRERVAPWLPDDVRANHGGLWESRLEPADYARVKAILKDTPPGKGRAKEHRPRVTLSDAD